MTFPYFKDLLGICFFGAIIIQYALHLLAHQKRKTNELWIVLPFSTYVLDFFLGVWAFVGTFTYVNGGPEIFPDIFGFGTWFGNGAYGLIYAMGILAGFIIGSLIWAISGVIRWLMRSRKHKH